MLGTVLQLPPAAANRGACALVRHSKSQNTGLRLLWKRGKGEEEGGRGLGLRGGGGVTRWEGRGVPQRLNDYPCVPSTALQRWGALFGVPEKCSYGCESALARDSTISVIGLKKPFRDFP